MKKVLALVLAAVMALGLITVVSAEALTPITSDPIGGSAPIDGEFFYGGDAESFFITAGGTFAVPVDAVVADLAKLNGKVDATLDASDLFYYGPDGTDKYTLEVSGLISNSKLKMTRELLTVGVSGNSKAKGAIIKITITPAKEFFTVEETTIEDVKITVKQSKNGDKFAEGELDLGDLTIVNKSSTEWDAEYDAKKDKYTIDDAEVVVDVGVFTSAKGSALEIDYDNYTVAFAKVANQNTSLYLKAATGVVAAPTKSIASIKFAATRVKDAATITIPINADNENYYGETVYVYALVDGKPSGAAIPAAVTNHNAVVFTVPAGSTLGTFAAYGSQAEGDAEVPAIPETGANDLVNIAIVFAVIALAAAGFVAVKKASK